MTIWNKIIFASAIGFGAYVIGNLIIFRQLEGVDYWEVRGYINGLVRGSGNRDTAISNLNNWRDYWYERAWWKGLVDHFYNHGMSRIEQLYG